MKKMFAHVRLSKVQKIGYPLGILIAIVLPLLFQGTFSRHVLCLILIWSILGMGWNFIGGYAGQVSIGHSVFYGIGAYTSALLFMWFNITPWIGMWVGMVISVFVAFCIGRPLLRLKGHYFAVATMAVAECCRVIFVNWKTVGGATGLDFLNKNVSMWYSMQFQDKLQYYYVFLVFAVVVLGIVIYFDRSKFGYYLRTIKGNENAAESVGIDTTRYKLIAYMLSAAIVSIGGSLYAQYMVYIDPTMLMVLKISLMICLVTVMGGIGTVIGPIIGAVVLTFISEYSRMLMGGTGTGIDQIIYGALVIIVVLYIPNGIVSLFKKRPKKQLKKGEEKAV